MCQDRGTVFVQNKQSPFFWIPPFELLVLNMAEGFIECTHGWLRSCTVTGSSITL